MGVWESLFQSPKVALSIKNRHFIFCYFGGSMEEGIILYAGTAGEVDGLELDLN